MRLSGSLGKSASDLFAELFPTGTLSLDIPQTAPSDLSSGPPASGNSDETTAQSGPPHAAALFMDDGSDGSLPGFDSATAGSTAPASTIDYQATASENSFYALSSDAYWSNDESVSHRFAEAAVDSHDGELVSIANESDATSAAGFVSPHFTFNDSTSAIPFASPHAEPSSGAAATSAPLDTHAAAAPASPSSEAPPALMLASDLGSVAVSTAGSGAAGSGTGSG